MSLRFEYPGGVLPHEVPLIEKFETEILPFVEKNGTEIGERAMQGDVDCEQIIRRHHLFVGGLAHLRQTNFRMLVAALKRWESKRSQ